MIRAGLTKLTQNQAAGTTPIALSLRRKRKHVDVEFEPEKQNKEEETKKFNELETAIKKDLTQVRSNKVLLFNNKIK